MRLGNGDVTYGLRRTFSVAKWLTYVPLGNIQQDRQCKYKRNIEARSRNHVCL